jgi:hypothetical protein
MKASAVTVISSIRLFFVATSNSPNLVVKHFFPLNKKNAGKNAFNILIVTFYSIFVPTMSSCISI